MTGATIAAFAAGVLLGLTLGAVLMACLCAVSDCDDQAGRP